MKLYHIALKNAYRHVFQSLCPSQVACENALDTFCYMIENCPHTILYEELKDFILIAATLGIGL